MSDLQDALDAWDNTIPTTDIQFDSIIDVARRVADPPPEVLSMLDDHPDLYEFSRKQVEALETLGVKMIPVKNEYIVKDVLDEIAALGITEDTG